MKFLVGHGGILVALFTRDDCVEAFLLMGRLILSFNAALAAPIRTGYEGIGAGVPCYHFDAPPLVARCTFYLDLLYKLFEVKFVFSCVELHIGFLQRGQWLVVGFCCTLLIQVLQNVWPQSGKIIGSSIRVSLKHKENMDFDCSEFSQKRIKGIHES